MSDSVTNLRNNILNYRFNPASIVRQGLAVLRDINNGVEVAIDPTNPFIQTIEMAAVETSAFMMEIEAESRRRYPLMAQTMEDLYLHMSDKDYINRFSTPAKANFSFMFFKEQMINAMVLDPTTGYRKLVVPRNTYVTVMGTSFSLQYPIEIRQLSHGGLQVVYVSDQVSPLKTLETNAIDVEVLTSSEGEWVQFSVEMQQFSIQQESKAISLASDLMIRMQFEDQFYFARVYHQNSNGTWTELATTHAESIYDVKVPTAVLRVVDSGLTVKIPQIYISTGQLKSKIRVDLYQSKGAINMPLGEYDMNAFQVKWESFDSSDSKKFSAPLANLSVRCFSPDIVNDGQNEMPFDTLRKNVILNSTGPTDFSITPAQIENTLTSKGYDVVKNVDNVTNRVFLATRSMPEPAITAAVNVTDRQLLTAAAASIQTLSATSEALAKLETVVDNGSCITLTPSTLYQVVNGITQPLNQSEVDRIMAMPIDKRAAEVTQGNYLYTPFHYVLDMSNNAFEIRPYYLDKPVAESKVFVGQNDTTLLQVGTSVYGVERTVTGYMLQVVTRSDDSYKALDDSQVFAQLSFTAVGERDRAYLNGVLVGKTEEGERIFNFDLSSTYNVDASNNLELTKFTMYNAEGRITKAPLQETFDIVYATSSTLSPYWRSNGIDQLLGRHLLPQQIAALNQERVKIRFGSALNMLWTRARTVVGDTPYRVWEADVPAVYESDVYQRDSNGSSIQIVNGEPTQVLLHAAGAPVLDGQGNPTYKHRKGDVMRDSAGNPIATNPRSLVRQMDLLLLEGVYWFGSDTTTKIYRQSLTDTLVAWLTNDLKTFTGNLLDQTRIYFYPKTTSGIVSVYTAEKVRKSILAGQSFNVTLAVPKQVYDSNLLRERLTISTISTIATQLKEKTVSVSKILKALREVYGSDVIDVQLSGLGGADNYPLLTMAADTDRLSVRKRLIAAADNSLVVEEDISCSFVLHDVD